MNIVSFLSGLKEKNIHVRLNGDDLKVSGIKKDTSADILRELKENKPALLSFLRRFEDEKPSAIPKAPELELYPISNAQRQLWLIDQTTAAGAAYNLFYAQDWNNYLDLEVLELSMRTLVSRHEVLRTVFREVDGDAFQKILSPEEANFKLRVFNAPSSRESCLSRIASEEAGHVFDLQNGPLLRLLVVTFSEKQHVLLLTTHHIVSDGWSMQLLVQELGTCYIALQKKMDPELEPLAIQYKDFAYWQQLPEMRQAYKAHKAYWLSALSGGMPLIDLPADRTRPSVKTYRGAHAQLAVSLPVLQQINELCQRTGCRMLSFLTSVFKTLVYRYTNEPDIAMGMPVAGRIYPELQAQVGYYVNMVVLRTQLQAHGSFEQLMVQVEQNLHKAYEHQEFPFDHLIEELGVRHDPSRSPLFDLLVSYEKKNMLLMEQPMNDKPSLTVSKFDLEADFMEYSDGLLVCLTYNVGLFSRERMDRLLGHFECLMLQALQNPAASLARLPYVPAGELAILEEFNQTDSWFPQDQTVVELLEQQVRQSPEELAIAFENVALSYSQFNASVNRLAHYLRQEHGICPGDRVGVMLERSERMVIAIYGIIKAGAAYVPIDPAYPLQRRTYMAVDCEAKLVITEKKCSDRLGCTVMNWESVDFTAYPAEDPAILHGPQHDVYMIYTSGSTGNPKGVPIKHSALTNLCQWFTDLIYKPAGHPLRVMLIGTISFDASVELLFPPLLNGCALQVVPQSLRDDPDELLHKINESAIQVVDLIPSHMHLVLQVAEGGSVKPSSLLYVITGGELLQQETVDLFFSILPNASILNGYGPTEACVDTSYCLLDAGMGAKPSCIGVPLPNMKMHILDPVMLDTGIGIWGEICIAGAGVAQGYWKREALTKEKFIDHPVYGRLYRSGDTGRWNEQGEVEFAGRSDNQVKIRGFRIEMGEVESAMQSFPEVMEAVITVKDTGKDKKLVAFVVWRNGAESVAVLRAHLSCVLPRYMIPEEYVAVRTIPRTGSGKLDRARLQFADSADDIASADAYIGATSVTEQRLLRIWEELLERQGIDVDENFFDLGGHSLKAMRMVSRICRELEVKISVKEIFQYDTIQKLAQWIDQQQLAAKYVQIEPVPTAKYYPLSPGQRSLWLTAQLEGGLSAYNMVNVYSWNGRLNKTLYQQAWMHLLKRHEILRTVFVLHAGEVYQQVQEVEEVKDTLHFADHSKLPAGQQQQAMQELLAAEQTYQYNLAHGPLVHVIVVKLSDTQYEMVLGIHHIISDAWSMQLMQAEVGAAYQALVEKKTLNDQPPRLQYRDYASWQNSRQLDAHRQYWMEHLSGELPVLELPADRLRPAKRSFEGNILVRVLGEEQLDALQAISRQQQCSLYTLLVATVNTLLYRYTSQTDIITGIPVAGRDHEELEKQLGYYVNTLATRHSIEAGESFESFLSKVKKTLLDAYAHQLYPFDRLAEDLGVQADPGRNPLFDVMVNYEHRQGVLDAAREAGEHPGVSRFDLSVHFTRYTNGLSVALTYNTSLFNRDRMLRMAGHLENMMRVVCADIHTPVSRLQYMDEAETRMLVHQFNETARYFGNPLPVHELFQMQAARSPQAPAVQFGQKTLSYGQLDLYSGSLANYLVSNYGISAGQRIGIMMDRSERMIIALLAILKSGAGYVPIDPAYPAERCRYMAEDSAISLLLTDDGYGAWYGGNVLTWNEHVWMGYKSKTAVTSRASDLAYIIYTSGSTGKPKGVMIRHESLYNLCAWLTDIIYRYDAKPMTVVVTASISFDASVKQLFPPLLSGSCLQIISEEERMSPMAYLSALQTGTNVADCTPSFLQLLLQLIKENRELVPAGLQYVLAGGEVLQKETVRLFHELLPAAKLVNVYGPTEACVDASYKLVNEVHDSYLMSIGKPLPNVRLFVIDELLQPVPAGIFGELVIGGVGLASGYYGQAGITAEKFIEHPQFGRVYRTGDLARWNMQGEIEFLGRKDGQVKIRGYRIEITEIENAMTAFEGVQDAAVVCTGHAGHQSLTAFICWNSTPQEAGLMAHLETQLPAYMLPSAIVAIDKLPKAPGGKTDRKALMELAAKDHSHSTSYTAPGTREEMALVAIWEELLGQHPIGIDDDFWKRGGHSLKAMRMMVMIFTRLKAEVSIKDIFTARTIRNLAILAGSKSASQARPIVAARSETGYYPIAHAQKRLWVIDQTEDNLTAYNIVHTYNIPAAIDAEVFSKAVHYLCERHEILRTVFVEHQGEVMQSIIPAEGFNPTVSFYEAKPGQDVRSSIEAVMQHEARRVFNLGNGPLFTMALFSLPEGGTACVLNMHHIISDAWSINIFKRELQAAYLAFEQQAQPMLAPLACQYKDYAAWLHNAIHDGELQAGKDYWNNLLAGELPLLELPVDHPRPLKKTYRGRQSSRLMPTQAMEAMKKLSLQHHCSIFSCLYANLNVLLYRYTHQRDIITGMPAAGRDRWELQDQLGFYVNVLPFRLQLQEDNHFEQLLESVQAMLSEQLEHQAYPFDQMVDDLNLRRDLSRSPIFDVLVNHQRYEVNADQVSFSLQTDGESGFSKYDLTFDFVEFNDGVLLSITYNTDLFNDNKALRMLSHFETLLQAVTLNPRQEIRSLQYFTADETEQAPDQTTVIYPAGKTVVQLLEAQAAGHGSAVALVFGDTVLTYRQFNEQVNRLAHALTQTYGIQAGDRVGLMLERSERMVITMYGIIKAGAAYVPVDPAYPQERRAYMAKDSAVKLIIAGKITEASLDCAVVHYDNIAFDQFSPLDPQNKPAPDDAAYMIYTSGSTGNPKGVLVQHKSLANLCYWYKDFMHSLSQEPLRIFLNASINFDVSVGQVFGALSTGAVLVVPDEQTRLSPPLLLEYLSAQQVDVFDCTPSFLQMLLQHIKESGLPCPVKYFLAGGEILLPETCDLFHEIFNDNAKLFNLYGPTEACVYATMDAVSLPASAQYRSIGRPVANARIYMLDTNLHQTAVGIWGELCIGGAGLAKGYWDREELTNEKFIQHNTLGRLYRTGDLARYKTDGSIEFKGRSDNQVKLRGYRIELGEVERAIQSCPHISEAVVLFNQQHQELLAFVVWNDQPADLQSYLSERLPAYMVPAQVIAMDSMPRSNSGKLDRVALQQMPLHLQRQTSYEAPASMTEQKLLNIWQQVLTQEGIGVTDDFFALGGHSLKAMRMVSAVYREFSVKLGIRDVFMHPAIRTLANFIERQARQQHPVIQPVEEAAYYPLSPGQRSLWFTAQQEGGLSAYNMVLRYSWEQQPDEHLYKTAWKLLLERHEILRTVFTVHEGTIWQQVQPMHAVAIDITFTDAAVDEVQHQHETHAFDLAHGPLIRSSVVKLPGDSYELFISMHHIVADAWSVKIIQRDLFELYRSLTDRVAPALPALRIQYKDVAAWQNGQQMDASKTYWSNMFAGELPVVDFPADHARPPVRNFHGHTITQLLDREVLDALNAICRRQQCSLFTLLAGCFKLLVYRYTAQEDLIAGIPVAGREQEDVQDGVGYYVNMMPLRTRIEPGSTFEKLLQHVKQHLLDGYAHQSYPVERLADDLGIRREQSRNALFDMVLNFDTAEHDMNIEAGESPAVSKFDLSIHFTQYHNGIAIACTYSTGLFTSTRMRNMLRHLSRLVAAVPLNMHQPLHAIPYLGADELQLVTNVFNDTRLVFDAEKTITELFDQQSALTPDHTAIYFNGVSTSYAGLQDASSRMAAYLRKHYHIRPGDRIGIMMDRTDRLVTALLAILKSGACYVPMDPAYPAARCQYMADNSRMKMLVAEHGYGAWCNLPVLDFAGTDWQSGPAEELSSVNDSRDLAYIIYTSGSTGQPKGVKVTHRSLHNLCAWHQQAFLADGNSRATMYAGIGFDASAWELWPYLLCGAAVYPLPDNLRYDLGALAGYLHQNKITHGFLPTPACEEIIRNNIALPHEMHVLTGGDRLKILPTHPMKLYNNYGPTETTVVATSMLLGSDTKPGCIPIGRPVSNTRIYILDAFMQPQPVGIYGEMFIAGEGVAEGYNDHDDLTAERFITFPSTGERLFRTGDFARWLEDGTIEFSGRIDGQVKVRGYRVEITEIEEAMVRIPGVDAVRVLADRSAAEIKLLGFYEGSITPQQLLSSLQLQLPSYMVPAGCMQVDKLPLTPNGKVDDRALMELHMALRTEDAPAQTLTGPEQRMALAWKEVLGTEPTHGQANFFDLGGHSMKAMQLIYLVEQSAGLKLSLRDIFNHPSLAAMASLQLNKRNEGLSIALNTTDSSLPVMYMIPPIVGSATIYSPLARSLSSRFRCTGLQYPGFDDAQPFAASIEETAERMYEEIMTGDDKKVYLLGYSLGALIAFEIAGLLEASGIQVQLILLDRDPVTQQDDALNMLPADAGDLLENEMQSWMEQTGLQLSGRNRELVMQNFRNLCAYRQQGLVNADVLAIAASSGRQQMDRWKVFTSGDVDSYTVDGDHYSLIHNDDVIKYLRRIAD